jgi:methionine sulfoxide reductase heme-binding subunit
LLANKLNTLKMQTIKAGLPHKRLIKPHINSIQLRWFKYCIFLLSLVPFLRLLWLTLNDQLGANPVEFIERSTGYWALCLLMLTLSITPIRHITGLTWIVQSRRMLGLFMFFYTCMHILTYVWLDYSFVWADIYLDIIQHPYVLVGFSAFCFTIALAITSNNLAMRKMRGHWKSLHKIVYLIAILGVIHFWWLVKKDITEPLIFALVLFALLSFRLYQRKKSKRD